MSVPVVIVICALIVLVLYGMQWLVILALINKRVVSLTQTFCVLVLMLIVDIAYLIWSLQGDENGLFKEGVMVYF